jgi:hypothetical protein
MVPQWLMYPFVMHLPRSELRSAAAWSRAIDTAPFLSLPHRLRFPLVRPCLSHFIVDVICRCEIGFYLQDFPSKTMEQGGPDL